MARTKIDNEFIKKAIKSDLMRVAQMAGRLDNPQNYDLWMFFIKKSAENFSKLPKNDPARELEKHFKALIQPKEKILYDAKSRLKWAEKVLDIACIIDKR